MEAARSRLSGITRNRAEYKTILEKLILQALYQTMEVNVSLRCRQADVELVDEVLPTVVDTYKKTIKQDVNIVIDKDNYLPANISGGVELIALNGRVKVNATQID